jgi:hypothetical protein
MNAIGYDGFFKVTGTATCHIFDALSAAVCCGFFLNPKLLCWIKIVDFVCAEIGEGWPTMRSVFGICSQASKEFYEYQVIANVSCHAWRCFVVCHISSASSRQRTHLTDQGR